MYDFYEYVVGMHFHFFIYRKTTRSAFCEQEQILCWQKVECPKESGREGHSTKKGLKEERSTRQVGYRTSYAFRREGRGTTKAAAGLFFLPLSPLLRFFPQGQRPSRPIPANSSFIKFYRKHLGPLSK